MAIDKAQIFLHIPFKSHSAQSLRSVSDRPLRFMNRISRFFSDARTGLESAWVSFSLQHSGRDARHQSEVLQRLLKDFALSDYGRAHELKPGLSFAQFCERAPLQNQESLQGAMAQLRAGLPNILWPGICRSFAALPFIPGEPERSLPLTHELCHQFQSAWRQAMLLGFERGCYAGTRPHSFLFPKKELPAKGRSAVPPSEIIEACLVQNGGIPQEPGEKLLVVGAHQPCTGPDILEKARNDRVYPPPNQVAFLCPTFGLDLSSLQERHGSRLKLLEVFASEFGIVAAQDGEYGQGLRVFANQGLLLEFIPLADYLGWIGELKTRTFPLWSVKTGVDYMLVVSSPSGLCRYVTNELVRFVSVSPARLLRLGRMESFLNVTGEMLNEYDLASVLTSLCAEQGWNVTHFHVAPLVTQTLTGRTFGRHEWWIELKPGTRQTPLGPLLAERIDASLMSVSSAYAERRRHGSLDSPIVRLVMPGVFEQWFRQNHLDLSSTRIPIGLPDRRIADSLSKLVRFYA
jgi:hypothetical protein